MHKTAKRHHARNADYNLYYDFEKIRDAFADASHDVKGKAGQMISESYEGLKEASVNTKDNVAAYVADRPFKAIGIAVLSGLVLAWLLKK